MLLAGILVLTDPVGGAVAAGSGEGTASWAGLNLAVPSAAAAGSPSVPGGQSDPPCGVVEDVARRHLAELDSRPDHAAPRLIALRRELERAVHACRRDRTGG